jgi:hypothetical protein
MARHSWIGMLALLVGCSFLVAQDEEKYQSGPKVGAFLPKPFECYNVNGPAKGRPECLVCKFALSPAVLVFSKEPAEGKDEAFTELLKQLDATAAEFVADRNFSVVVVILSPDARDSTNNAQAKSVNELTKDAEKNPEEVAKLLREQAKKLIEEAGKREKLLERLTKRAENLKHVIVAYLPEAPAEYKLNPKAEMTFLFYERMKVLDNYAFAPGTLDDKQVKTMVDRVREALPLKKPAQEK